MRIQSTGPSNPDNRRLALADEGTLETARPPWWSVKAKPMPRFSENPLPAGVPCGRGKHSAQACRGADLSSSRCLLTTPTGGITRPTKRAAQECFVPSADLAGAINSNASKSRQLGLLPEDERSTSVDLPQSRKALLVRAIPVWKGTAFDVNCDAAIRLGYRICSEVSYRAVGRFFVFVRGTLP